MKAIILSTISGILVGIVVTYFTLDWKEERLTYTLTDPAKFGDITFQNIEIRNDGFDPATHVMIYLPQKVMGSKHIQIAGTFDLKGDGESTIGGFERIRRGERVLIPLISKTEPVSATDVTIKSDRSIATVSTPNARRLDVGSIMIGVVTATLALFGAFMAAVVPPAYKDYVRKVEEAKQRSIDEWNKLAEEQSNKTANRTES